MEHIMHNGKIIQLLFLVLIIGSFVIFFCRSGIFLKRSVNDIFLFAKHSISPYFPEIKECSVFEKSFNAEQIHLWKYRNLGAE